MALRVTVRACNTDDQKSLLSTPIGENGELELESPNLGTLLVTGHYIDVMIETVRAMESKTLWVARVTGKVDEALRLELFPKGELRRVLHFPA